MAANWFQGWSSEYFSFFPFLVLLLFTQRSLKYHLIILFSFSSLHHFSNTILQYQTLWSLQLLRTSARNICRLWMLLPYTKLLLLNFTHPPPLTVTLFLTSHTFLKLLCQSIKLTKLERTHSVLSVRGGECIQYLKSFLFLLWEILI